MSKKNTTQIHFHRSQISRAQRFMRTHRHENLSLKIIAKEAGASLYHFGRLFNAYTGETVFDFLRRIRLSSSLRMLEEDMEGSITEIALATGYETPSAFNKAFKSVLKLTPSEFRNLGQAARDKIQYDLSKSPEMKEVSLKNLSKNYEIVKRPVIHFIYVEKRGPFQEMAQIAWPEMFENVLAKIDQSCIREFLGLSGIDKAHKDEEAQIYSAGLGLSQEPERKLKGSEYRKIPAGNYAKFVLKGSYSQIWPAFREVFKKLAENNVQLREEFCIENYLNDPVRTPEPELVTEILVPVK